MQTMDGESKLSARSVQMFQTLLILLLASLNTGEAVGQYHSVVASLGITRDVTLPCHVEPATDATDEMLEWSRPDLHPRFIHVRRDGEDHLVDQNPSYAGRTSVSVDGLKQGNMSLRLSRLRLSDEGVYSCFCPQLKTHSGVQLVVTVGIEITRVGAGVLECKSAGWYPEPELLWLDGEGKLLSAGPTETVRGPDDLYTVSSRVTVEKKHGNNFTCRVQQNNEHRDAKIHVPDDFFMDSSANSIIPTVIALLLFVLAALAFALVAWRQNKTKTKKNSEDEESQDKTVTKGRFLSHDLEKESLIKTKKEVAEQQAETAKLVNQNGVEEEHNTTGPEASQKILNNDQQQSDERSVKAGTQSESAVEPERQQVKNQTENTETPVKTQNPGESRKHQELLEKNDERINEEGAQSIDPKLGGEQEQQGTKEEGGSKNKTFEINANIQSESREIQRTTKAEKPEKGEEDDDEEEQVPEKAADTKAGEEEAEKEAEERSKNNKSEIHSNIQAESQEKQSTSSGKPQEPGKHEEAEPQQKPRTPQEHVDRGDTENASPSMKTYTADQNLTSGNMKEKSTENTDTAAQNPSEGVETLQGPSAAEPKTESVETLSPSPAAVDNGKDEQTVKNKTPEPNLKEGEAANKDTVNEENEHKTQATNGGTAV